MNDAGRSVGPARGAYRLPLDRVLLIHDEIDLPFGEIRSRVGGGLAGHNGLKSLRRGLGGSEFVRVRVGVGRPDSTDPEVVAAYVLSRFREPAGDVAALVRARVRRSRCDRRRHDRRLTMLSPLLDHLAESEDGLALAASGGDAFCSSALRPFLIAALLARADDRAAIVVAPDDRAAGELAADLAAWLAPRRVRFYPSRGVTYESHLAPPPHLVGLRIAALDALGGGAPEAPAGAAPVLVASATALSEKVPDPALRPRSFELAVGDLLDLDECAQLLIEMGYERVSQVEDRGQFALRGGLLDLFAATAERAVRVELFDIEIESLRTFSTFTQRSLDSIERIDVAPAAELALEHRGVALEGERPDIAELLPLQRFRPLLELVGGDAALIVVASEEIGPTLHDHWADVCAAFHDAEAHGLYVAPAEIEAVLDSRARIRLHSLAGRAPVSFHAQAAGGTARSLTEAESELERDLRSGYRTVVTWARRGDGERAAHNLARLRAGWIEDAPPPDRLTFAHATLREGFVAPGLRLAVIPDHLLFHRRRAPARPRSVAAARRARSPSCGPATSSCTRITGSRASPASRRARWPASRATTCISNTTATTASTRRRISLRRSRATSGPEASTRRCRASAARAGTR